MIKVSLLIYIYLHCSKEIGSVYYMFVVFYTPGRTDTEESNPGVYFEKGEIMF